MAKLITKYIEDKAVTLAKMADIATSSIMGRKTAGTGAQEVLSASDVRTLINVEDGANNYSLPTASDSVLGGVKVDGTTITITNGVISSVGGGETKVVQTITLDATDISNKYNDDLAHTPATASSVEIIPVGGIPQVYTTDFTVITDGSAVKRINWDGLGLDGVLESGDKLIVSYTY